ncbi:hypothetical protein AAH991_21130 [Microbispora sp. ZYX-F-249]|uniref:Uncharacterized protein n=1 Tax=Microbispora maris TaxID=3144104 RepID=A0ABV0AQS8_9ACTN
MPVTEERIDAIEREITGIRSDVRLQNAMLIKCGEQMSDLRTGQHELRKGQEELYAITAELRAGQEEIRETLEEFRSAFAVVLDEIRQQKAWREEFSDKLARVIAKSEGIDA